MRSWQQGKRINTRLKQAENEVEQLHAKGDILLGKQRRNETRIGDLRLDHNSAICELQSLMTESQGVLESQVKEVEMTSTTTLEHVEETKQATLNKLDELTIASTNSKTKTIELIETMTTQLTEVQTSRNEQLVGQMKQLHELIKGKKF